MQVAKFITLTSLSFKISYKLMFENVFPPWFYAEVL